jgi:hypothetical protein
LPDPNPWFDPSQNIAAFIPRYNNIDETSVTLSVLASSKYLISAEMQKTYRGASSKRTLITVVECISNDGRSLPPLIIFPGVDLRSN